MIDVVNASQFSFLPFGRSIEGIEDEQMDIRWYVASCEGGDLLPVQDRGQELIYSIGYNVYKQALFTVLQ